MNLIPRIPLVDRGRKIVSEHSHPWKLALLNLKDLDKTYENISNRKQLQTTVCVVVSLPDLKVCPLASLGRALVKLTSVAYTVAENGALLSRTHYVRERIGLSPQFFPSFPPVAHTVARGREKGSPCGFPLSIPSLFPLVGHRVYLVFLSAP